MAKKKKVTKKKASKKVTKKRAVSHAGARAKGLNFEREVATAIGVIFPDAQRRLEYQASQINGADLDNTGPFRIQCKRFAGYASISKIREVHPEEGTIPVLVTKGNKMKAVACLYFEDFIDLLTRIFGVANEKLVDLSGANDIVVESSAPKQIDMTKESFAQVIYEDEEHPMADIVEDGGELFEAEDGETKTANDIFNPAKDINDFM